MRFLRVKRIGRDEDILHFRVLKNLKVIRKSILDRPNSSVCKNDSKLFILVYFNFLRSVPLSHSISLTGVFGFRVSFLRYLSEAKVIIITCADARISVRKRDPVELCVHIYIVDSSSSSYLTRKSISFRSDRNSSRSIDTENGFYKFMQLVYMLNSTEYSRITINFTENTIFIR